MAVCTFHISTYSYIILITYSRDRCQSMFQLGIHTSYSMIIPPCTPRIAPSFMCHQQTSQGEAASACLLRLPPWHPFAWSPSAKSKSTPSGFNVPLVSTRHPSSSSQHESHTKAHGSSAGPHSQMILHYIALPTMKCTKNPLERRRRARDRGHNPHHAATQSLCCRLLYKDRLGQRSSCECAKQIVEHSEGSKSICKSWLATKTSTETNSLPPCWL